MQESSLHSMPVEVVEITELLRKSEDVADFVSDAPEPEVEPRIAIAVEKSLTTQFSNETVVFSEIQR